MPDISSSLSKREVNARQNTYTKSEIDLKDGAIQAIAEAAQTTADAAEKKNQEQDQLIAELQRSAHTHSNKGVLDKIEQPYTTAERDKLAGLENYTHPTYTAHAKGFYKFASDGEGHVTEAGTVTKEDITALGIPDKDTNTTYRLVQDGIAINMLGSDGSSSEVGLKPTITKRLYGWINHEVNTDDTGKILIDAYLGASPVRWDSVLTEPTKVEVGYDVGGQVKTLITDFANDILVYNVVSQNCSTTVTGKWNLVEGNANKVYGNNNLVGGEHNQITEHGASSVVSGYGLYCDAVNQTVLGRYNAKDTGSVDNAWNSYYGKYVLIIGNGSDSNTGRSNAFAVDWDGNLWCGKDKTSLNAQVASKQDKLTAGTNITISGSTISAKDTTYSDATQSTHGLMTAADKKKLDGMDLTKYLPKSGGVMTGDIDMQANKRDILVGTHKATTSDGTAVAGGSITTAGYVGDKLKAARSFIGTVTGNDGVWWDVISVRHRNGYTDGVNYGMYLFSKLASTGNLSWNKQVAANTWQGDRTLLDSVNYSDYAAPLSHTHKNIDSIGNVGYYGSDKASTNGWYKFYSGTLTGYNDRTARLMLTYMYGYNNFGTIFFHARCNNGNTIQIQRLLWEVRSGFEDGDVVAVAKGNDYSLYVYNRNPQWGRIKIRVLESGGTSSAWDMTLASNFTKESTAPTPTIVASDGCTVANATTWNGLINDVDTYNSSDTWVLVKKDNRIQHRYAGELDVNSAKTLTDSGWVTCPLAVTGNTTYPSSSSIIKVRKYGKLVRLEAAVKYKTAFGTGHNVATIPEGYRPSVLQREHGITSTATEKIWFDATLGVGGNLSFAPAGNSSYEFNPANSYECRMTYFID